MNKNKKSIAAMEHFQSKKLLARENKHQVLLIRTKKREIFPFCYKQYLQHLIPSEARLICTESFY